MHTHTNISTIPFLFFCGIGDIGGIANSYIIGNFIRIPLQEAGIIYCREVVFLSVPATDYNKMQQKLELVPDLNLQKQKAIQLGLAGKTVTQIAELLHVDRSTVHRWLKDPRVIAAKNRLTLEMWEASHSRLQALMGKSIDVLEKQLDSGNLKAALAVLNATGILRSTKPDLETEEALVLKQMAEKLTLDSWGGSPFAGKTEIKKAVLNPNFMDQANWIHQELLERFTPSPPEGEELFMAALDKEGARLDRLGNRANRNHTETKPTT